MHLSHNEDFATSSHPAYIHIYNHKFLRKRGDKFLFRTFKLKAVYEIRTHVFAMEVQDTKPLYEYRK